MIVPLSIILSFIAYMILYFLQKNQTVLRSTIFLICSLLTLCSLLVFCSTQVEIFCSIPLGTICSIVIGPIFLFLLTPDKFDTTKFLYFVLGIGLIGGSFYFITLYSSYDLALIEQFVIASLVLSCISFGSYGYLEYINYPKHLMKQKKEILFYLLLLFCCTFFFSILLIEKKQNIFEANRIFSIYSFCFIVYAFLSELLIFYVGFDLDRFITKFLEQNRSGDVTVVDSIASLSLRETTIYMEKERAKRIDEKQITDRIALSHLLYKEVIDTKLFLQSNLTLADLSDQINTDKNKLIHYFKQSASLNFKQYINRLKIEYAITVIEEREKDVTVEELTIICGFNTRLSFYRAFVYFYGFAPSALLED